MRVIPNARTILVVGILFSPASMSAEESKPPSPTTQPAAPMSFHSMTVKDIDGNDVSLSKYEGNVCLVVNVASKCGLTPQYEGLEALFRKYKDQGFRILAFPANNFGQQEPGPNDEIKKFCQGKYNVTFDLFAKISVKGDDQAPLYQFLTKHPDSAIAGDIQWNFQKYLVGRDGRVMAKFEPRTKPSDEKLTAAIEKALSEKQPDRDKAPTTPATSRGGA